MNDCLNCEEGSTCYECYILSGQEEKDLRDANADEETLKRFGYYTNKMGNKILNPDAVSEKDKFFYCGICELEHDIKDTSCVRPSEDCVLIRYEDKHGV